MPTVGAGETSEKRAACRRRGTAARAAATSAAAAAGREALLAAHTQSRSLCGGRLCWPLDCGGTMYDVGSMERRSRGQLHRAVLGAAAAHTSLSTVR